MNGQPYGPWSDWSECSVDEGQGVMSRTRGCSVDNCPQSGEYLEFMACFVIVKPCKCECPPTSGTRQSQYKLKIDGCNVLREARAR